MAKDCKGNEIRVGMYVRWSKGGSSFQWDNPDLLGPDCKLKVTKINDNGGSGYIDIEGAKGNWFAANSFEVVVPGFKISYEVTVTEKVRKEYVVVDLEKELTRILEEHPEVDEVRISKPFP